MFYVRSSTDAKLLFFNITADFINCNVHFSMNPSASQGLPILVMNPICSQGGLINPIGLRCGNVCSALQMR